MTRYAIVIAQQSTTTYIENLRVGGSIPPSGTTFTKKNNNLGRRKTPYACVNQKHTKHTLFAVFACFYTSGIAVLNTVFVVVSWEHCAGCYVANTVLAEFWGNTVRDTDFRYMLWEQKPRSIACPALTFGVKPWRQVASNCETGNLRRYKSTIALGGTCRCIQTLKLIALKSC